MSDNVKKWLRYASYGILMLVGYFVQFTPFMIPVFGSYPMPLLMLCIIIAMFEKDITAAVCGLACGLLTDINCINGNGLHALLYMFAAVLISLLIKTLLQNNMLSLICISAIAFGINSVVEMLTKSALSEGAVSLYFSFFFKNAVYSFVAIIPSYIIFALIFGHSLHYKKPKGIVALRNENKKSRKNNDTDKVKLNKGY